MKSKTRLLINNLFIIIIPILVIFISLNILIKNQVEESITKRIDDSITTMTKDIENRVDKYLNYAYLFSKDQYMVSTLIKKRILLQSYTINLSGLEIDLIEVCISNNVINRRSFSTENFYYISDDNSINRMWNYLSKPFYNKEYKTSFPDFVSNTLVVRNASIIYDEEKGEKIGLYILSLPLSATRIKQYNNNTEDMIVFIEFENSIQFSDSILLNNTDLIKISNSFTNSDSVYDIVDLSIGKYYVTKRVLYKERDKDFAKIGVLFDYDKINITSNYLNTVSFILLLVTLVIVVILSLLFVNKINKSIARFVPQKFLSLLKKESIGDVFHGDNTLKEMTVLFSDIRSFTSISENLSPSEVFNLINEYLSVMEPIINRHNGFIDKYIGDAIMALFPEKPDDAIDSAIEMMTELSVFNKKREKNYLSPIGIGVGIHTGDLLLGIVGSKERMEGTVLSDVVNLASRLESLTKYYGADIIVSESSLFNCEDPTKYHFHILDSVKVKGKSKQTSIFEILNGYEETVKRLKLISFADYERAFLLYQNKDFKNALSIFNEILKINQNDKAVKLFIKRCETIIDYGLPSDWDGIEILEIK